MILKNELALLPGVLFFVALGILIFFIRQRQIKKSQALIHFFKARPVGLLGTIEFPFSKTLFRILRIANGAGLAGVGGSFPTLWAYTKPCHKIIIGNSKSGKYTKGRFLILPPHLISNISGTDILIGAESKEAIEKIRVQLAGDPNISEALALIFRNDFCHFTVSSEFHVGGPFILRKKYVFRYTCLPEQIYENPIILESTIKVIMEMAQSIRIQFEEI